MELGRELLNAPFPELVRTLGVGIAEAQYALDRVSIRIAQLMAGFKLDDNGNLVQDETALIKLREGDPGVSLLSLGFTPTFYQFVETYIEIKMAISVMKQQEFGIKTTVGAAVWSPFGAAAASVNAAYSQKYQYDASGSSEMRTKLVTVPTPTMFERRLKELMDETNIANNTPPPAEEEEEEQVIDG